MKPGMLKPVRAVVFDFDGTLAETRIDFALMRQRTLEAIRAFGLWSEGDDEQRYVLELVEGAAAKLAHDPDRQAEYRREAARAIEDVEMLTCPRARPFEGTVEALQMLRDHGMGVGIITRNCRRGVEAVTSRFHLHYDVLLTRDDVEKVKPEKEHLLEALEALEVGPASAVMVGDHKTDIEVGKAAGTLTCGVLTDRTPREELEAAGADFVLSSAAEFVGLLCANGRPQRQDD